MNDPNSIAGIDDFADEMKNNLEALHELQFKYKKMLAFIQSNNCDCLRPSGVSHQDCCVYYKAQELLKELEG